MGLVFCILPVPFFRTNDSGFVGLGVDSASIMSIISSIIDPFYENKNKNNRRFEKNIPGRASVASRSSCHQVREGRSLAFLEKKKSRLLLLLLLVAG